MPTPTYGQLVQSEYLQYQQGTSDKVYELELREEHGRFSVIGYYGRRGGGLTQAVKCRAVTEYVARREYQAVLDEKLNKGYRRRNHMPFVHRPNFDPIVVDDVDERPAVAEPVGPTRRKKIANNVVVVPGGRKLVI